MGDRLKGKVAIVTGGGRGIGRAEALCLAAEGAKVVVNDYGGNIEGYEASSRPADDVVAEIKKLGGSAVANYDSVTSSRGCDNIIKAALDSFGRLDILVNNAGNNVNKMVWEMSDEEWDHVLKTHLYGTFYCTRAASRIFREQRSGRIISTSSEAGEGWAGQVNYSAAKEGIVGFTKTAARELSQYDVTCNAIRPRAWTRLADQPEWHEKHEALKAKTDAESRRLVALFDEIREQRPEYVAPLVAYLASDEAANVSGCVFVVGGRQISLQGPRPQNVMWAERAWTVDAIAELFPTTIGRGIVKLDLNTPPG